MARLDRAIRAGRHATAGPLTPRSSRGVTSVVDQAPPFRIFSSSAVTLSFTSS